MRAFVFLLILVNLLFFAWTRDYFALSSGPDAQRVRQQLLPDRVKVVSNDEAPPEIASKAEKSARTLEKQPAAEEACLSLDDLPEADADRLESQLAGNLPAFKVARSARPGSSSFWVHIPPLNSKRDVETKMAELKKLGVKDMFVVQENGPNNRAISLGLFSSRDAASAFLETLRDKGVRSARLAERAGKPASARLEIRGPGAQAEALSQALAGALPSVKPSACKGPAASSTQ